MGSVAVVVCYNGMYEYNNEAVQNNRPSRRRKIRVWMCPRIENENKPPGFQGSMNAKTMVPRGEPVDNREK